MISLFRHIPAWLALVACVVAGHVHAAATADELTRQALLRGYTTAEAQRRYDELRNSGASASTAPGQAAAAGLGALAANIQRRQNEQNAADERIWTYLDRGLDVPLETRGDADALNKLLRRNAEDADYNIAARRRIVEYALHQRAHSKQFFEQRDPGYAAAMLRRNAYADLDFDPWSALMLAKLYLGGVGVPQDEGEALYLVELCQQRVLQLFKNTLSGTMGCHVLRAQMQRNGWSGPADEAASKDTMRNARAVFRAATGRDLSDEQLLALFR